MTNQPPRDEDEALLICVLADKIAHAVEGPTFGGSCSKCGRRVVMTPSSRQLLASQPHVKVVCTGCYAPDPDVEVDVHLTAPAEQVAREVAQAHMRGRRN